MYNFELGLFVLIFNLLAWLNVHGQSDLRPLLKAGGFVYFTDSEYSGFSLHLEYEKAIRNKEFLTSGPRIDYTYTKFLQGYRYSGDVGPKLYVGYELKFYPMYWKSNIPYRGIFIGIEPLFLMQGENEFYRYGPGVAALAGYQHMFKKRFSLSFEGSMIYFQNLNERRRPDNPDDRYFNLFACIKFGIKLGKAANIKQ